MRSVWVESIPEAGVIPFASLSRISDPNRTPCHFNPAIRPSSFEEKLECKLRGLSFEFRILGFEGFTGMATIKPTSMQS